MTKPRCPYYGACGGCQLQHLPYEEQLAMKTKMVRGELDKQGLAGAPIWPTIGMEDPWFYRNKIQFPIREQNGKLQMGYFKQKSHEVVNIKECYIQDPFLTEIAQISREIFEERKLPAYDEKTGKGVLRHFIGRSGFQTHELLLGIVVNARGLPAGFTVADEIKKRERLLHRMVVRHGEYPKFEDKRRIVGIVQNMNTARGNVIMGRYNTTLLGIPFLREKLGRFTFKVQLLSFFQVNPRQTVKLYNLVKRFAEIAPEDVVVDAYAGIGTIAFWLADKAASVVGIEEREEAVKDARQNMSLNKLTNVEMKGGLVEKLMPKKADVVILDPPRGGCSDKVLESICKANPRRVVYVSCSPETMARDLTKLVKNGFEIENVQPVDMFPHTNHVEAAVKLSRHG